MSKTRTLLPLLRRLTTVAALAAAAVSVTAARGVAQTVVVMVNGDPITNYDIEQRTKLIQLSTHKVTPRQEVIDELIDEAIKIQQLRRYNIDGMDKDVDSAYANMARRMRLTPPQFSEQLARGGVMPGTLKSRIKAEIIWSQIIRAKYQSSFQFSDKDVLAKLETKASDESAVIAYDYTLRPILFIVPRGSPPTVVDARKREADGLRARFQDCESGITFARGLRDVAVRAPVVKSSAELAPELRAILEKTEMGRLTAPEVTAQGVEVYALCSKKQSNTENSPGKRKVREELFTEQFQNHSKRFIKELRSQAMIEYR